jgi:sugar lactone lactonase YvrE
MIVMQAELILDARNATGECPVWDAKEQALYWVDIPAKRLHRWSPLDNRTQSWEARASQAMATAVGWPARKTGCSGYVQTTTAPLRRIG